MHAVIYVQDVKRWNLLFLSYGVIRESLWIHIDVYI